VDILVAGVGTGDTITGELWLMRLRYRIVWYRLILQAWCIFWWQGSGQEALSQVIGWLAFGLKMSGV
jgi:hypothetical protein